MTHDEAGRIAGEASARWKAAKKPGLRNPRLSEAEVLEYRGAKAVVSAELVAAGHGPLVGGV